MSTKKSLALSREVANKLKMRFAEAGVALSVVEGFDASNNPTIDINDGTPAAGEQNMFVRILEIPSIGSSSIAGVAQPSYGPHVVQIAMETSAAAGVALVTEANKLRALWELIKLGARAEVYLETNGTRPTVSTIVPAKLALTIDHALFPLSGS